jgi:hypothetical protein
MSERKTHIRNSHRHQGATMQLYMTLCGIEVYGDDRVVANAREATCLTCRQFLPAAPPPSEEQP